MQPTGSQTGLKVVSILDIISAVILLLTGFLLFAGGAVMGEDPSLGADAAAQLGTDSTVVAGLAAGLGIVLVVSAIITFITGILGLRAAKDNTKVKPVWILAIIALVFSVFSFITNIIGGAEAGSIGSSLGGLIMPAVTFWLANNVKKEAGL